MHPYPSRADLSRERAAAAQSFGDLATLRRMHCIVSRALLEFSQLPEIEHPDASCSVAGTGRMFQELLADLEADERVIRRNPIIVFIGD